MRWLCRGVFFFLPCGGGVCEALRGACGRVADKRFHRSRSDYLFKLLLIGDSGVGKSCLLLRFAVSFVCPQ